MARPSTPTVRIPARQRLLEAAARAYARSGLEGATTRDIAREAKVNEVTLFRHFKSKEKLLAAVVRRTFDQQEKALASGAPEPTTDLRSGLQDYARRYHELLADNLPILRTLIGEIHRYRKHEYRVFKGIFAPLKTELLATMEQAKERGLLRPEIKAGLAADVFSSMIFTEVLRRNSPSACLTYPAGEYLESCVDIFVSGVEAKVEKKGRGAKKR